MLEFLDPTPEKHGETGHLNGCQHQAAILFALPLLLQQSLAGGPGKAKLRGKNRPDSKYLGLFLGFLMVREGTSCYPTLGQSQPRGAGPPVACFGLHASVERSSISPEMCVEDGDKWLSPMLKRKIVK